MTVVVMAKAPRPGRCKTRLCPPCSPRQAASLAEAALRDTLDVASSASGAQVVLALDGAPGEWMRSGVAVIPQRGGGLGERIGNAIDDAWGIAREPLLVVGMDTPQITHALIDGAFGALRDHDAALGYAADGGWWALALREPRRGAFDGVPMSTARTGRMQHARLRSLGLEVAMLPVLRDVDTIADAWEVAALAPKTRFARLLRAEILESVS